MFLNYFQKIMYRSYEIGKREILNYFSDNCDCKVIINFTKRSQKHRNTCQWCLMKNWWYVGFFFLFSKFYFKLWFLFFPPKTKIYKYYEYCFQWGTWCSDPIRNIYTITYLRKLEYEHTFMVHTGSRTYIRGETSSELKRARARFLFLYQSSESSPK